MPARRSRWPDAREPVLVVGHQFTLGLTAAYLLRRTYRVQPGDAVLIHAAAGGVGLIACQWAKALGLQLIGTAGSDDKCAACLALGADHAINYKTQDLAKALEAATLLAVGRAAEILDDLKGER